MRVFQLGTVLLLLIGCVARPPRVEAPRWKPEKMAADLFEMVDADGNDQLSRQELAAVPGVLASFERIDANQDGAIDRAELISRLQLYKDLRIGLKQQAIQVLYKQQPLINATVRLVPESFQGDVIRPAEGTTDFDGVVHPSAEGEAHPGLQLGFYRLQITSDTVDLPPKFNSNTTLGLEVSPISEGIDSYGPIRVELR